MVFIDLQEPTEIEIKAMRNLYVSCVGSHMWGMNNEQSDIDLVMIYIAPTRAILRGEKFPSTVRQQIAPKNGEIYDTLGWEIGHLIDQLIKGNINAIWYATSPLVIKPSRVQEELSDLVRANLSRLTYHSIKGMAESQIKSDETPEKKPKIPGKGYRTALRTINFGIKLLSEGGICFSPVLHAPSAEEVMERMEQLDEAYLKSPLPDRPDEEDFREFLLKLRMEEMAGERNLIKN